MVAGAETPIEETLAVFDELVKAGKIRHFGLSNESTWGLMRFIAEAGKGIVLISSEMQEIVGMADRVLVMRRGRIMGELAGGRVTEKDIIRLAMGLNEEPNHV